MSKETHIVQTMAANQDPQPQTYPMRVVTRMTGLSAERLRAWETRHGAIEPLRTQGGSRRYTEGDVERLRLLRRATEAGHRIGDLANLEIDALRERVGPRDDSGEGRFDEMIFAVDALDAGLLRSLLEERARHLDPVSFAFEEALPLAAEIGRRWVEGLTSVSAEHRATNVLRSMLIESVEAGPVDALGPRILFASPEGERHDLGVLAAAIAARAFGAQSIFIGADVPVPELVKEAETSRSEALALGFVVLPKDEVESVLRDVRRALPEDIALWIGGQGIMGCPPIPGVDRIENAQRLEGFVLEARRSEDRGGS